MLAAARLGAAIRASVLRQGARASAKRIEMKKIILTIVLLGAFAVEAAERYVPEYLGRISVTVRAQSGYSRSEGSGTLFKRKVDGKDKVYCLSAAHVVEHLRNTREEIVDGKPRKVVEFDDPSLVRKLRNPKTGRIVGEVVVASKILKYSDADTGHDLVIMELMSDDIETESAAIYPKDGPLIRVGTRLLHCGSLLGSDGAGSITDGILSAHGRLLHGKISLTQSTLTAFPGSSGGGCYLPDGRLIGVLVRGTPTQGFNLHVPIKRLWTFAEQAKCEWVLDPTIKITQKEIDAMPIEDVGVKAGAGPDKKLYPFLIHRVDLREAKGGAK